MRLSDYILCHRICNPHAGMNVIDARLVRGCSRAALGVRILTSVRRIRRCATTARVETWRTVMRATAMRVTLVRRVVNAEMLCL